MNTVVAGTIASLLLGLGVGWWLTAVLVRAPAGLPLLRGPSTTEATAEMGASQILIVAGSALAFAATCLVVGPSWDLPLLWFLAALAIVASAIDLQHRRLPDVLILPSYPITGALLLLALLGPGDLGDLGRAALGGVALFVGYFLLAMINPAGMGGGDVKLAGVLGLILGWFGWAQVIVGGLAAFFIGAFASVVLLLLGRAGRKSSIPFGPFMFLGAYVGLLAGTSIAEWYLS